MRKIILLANTDWYLFNFRYSLIKMLQNQGDQVLLVSPSGKYADQFQKEGLEWRDWNVRRRSLSPLTESLSLLKLRQLYKKETPDVIHHHTLKAVIYGSLACYGLKSPKIINSIPGFGYVFSSQEMLAKLLRPIIKALLTIASRITTAIWIFENQQDQDFFLEFTKTDPGRTFLVQGVGVDTEKYSPTPEPVGTPAIGYVGRMLKDKGVESLVEAVRAINITSENVHLHIVGDIDRGNPSTIDTQTLQDWDTECFITWHGWLEDTRKVYQICNLIVVPTYYGEGVPTVLLEAGASGRAVIATDISGCREVITHGQNGLLVEPKNKQALMSAINKLISDDRLRARLALANRDVITKHFSNQIVNEETIAIYNSCS